MFERFTSRARAVMARANQQAQHLDHEYIGTENILLALIDEGSGVGVGVLKSMGVRLEDVTDAVLKRLDNSPTDQPQWIQSQTECSKNALWFAMTEGRDLGHGHIGTEHVLLGLLSESDGIAFGVLNEFGISLDKAREKTIELLDSDD